jgi:hypothetical protein
MEGEESDQPLEVHLAELVREQVLRRTFQEVPHAVEVEIDELEQRDDGLLDLAGRPPAAAPPPPRLLGSYDPVLLGWTSREPLLGPHHAVITANGLFRPFALVGGRAAATWSMPGGKVVLEPFRRLSREDEAALEADAADVVRFLTG